MMPPQIVALETVELNASVDLYRAAAPELIASAGLAVHEVDGAVICVASHVDVLALNRVLGLGLRTGPDEAALDNLISACGRVGSSRLFVPVAPTEHAGALAAALERRGLRHYNNWMRLSRPLTGPIPDMAAPVDVRPIGTADSATFGRIVSTAFGFPPSIASLPSQTIGRPGWSHYLAYADGRTPIAAAAMYLDGDAAWFGFAATDADSRGRGAQKALVVRRLTDAAAAGCRWVSVETAEDTVEKGAPSFRNLVKLGFEVAYRRPNYLWTRSYASST